ncbi:type IV secretion system DNA-binding domain-containing protein [Geobacter sp. DSM 9736]|uniref:type IV secretion system DNA-binding domain-containing protein n=1 Tax=Geobacter sp. DSM 9736 TaxID=1277350 RepID=UPI000B508BCE|nr:type IV secretion system DNA-binding domain-containing protein [Geobacter sp. DSM 9736]SNB45171.1 Type IV secretion-system coupling protein DNA-binding domain-containing protein [Geobacter sp. DSM 9736]
MAQLPKMNPSDLAAQIIPSSTDPFWVNHARDLCVALIHYCRYRDIYETDQLVRVAKRPTDELQNLLKGVPGCERGYTLLHLNDSFVWTVRGIVMEAVTEYTAGRR